MPSLLTGIDKEGAGKGLRFGLLILMLLSASPHLLFSQHFSFYNDGLGWGLIPEWDDYETYSFRSAWPLSPGAGELRYDAYTYRGQTAEQGRRIDGVTARFYLRGELETDMRLLLSARAGFGGRLFGRLGGMAIQTGWHGNIDVARPVPESYEEPFRQLLLPLEVAAAFTAVAEWRFSLRGEAVLPGGFTGSLSLEALLPKTLLPVTWEAAYRGALLDYGPSSWKSAEEKQTGLSFGTLLDLWPLRITKIRYLNRDWGTGSIGFFLRAPEGRAPPGVSAELFISAVTHQAYGVKVLRELPGRAGPFTWALYYREQSGWLDMPVSYPQGGRYALLGLGLEPRLALMLGPLRWEGYLSAGFSFRQERYYELAVTEMSPLAQGSYLTGDVGGGLRLLFPFPAERFLGIGFELIYSGSILKSGSRQDALPPVRPWRCGLSLAVSS